MPPMIEDQQYVSTKQSNQYNTSPVSSHTPQQPRPPLSNVAYHSITAPHGYVSFLDRLRELPTVRSIPWRQGQELAPEKAGESGRVQCRGAVLLVTRGRVMENPCSNCAAGHGRFSVCVTLDDWFQGSCASCNFTSKGNRCSLRVKKLGDEDITKSPVDAKPAKKRKSKAAPRAKIQFDGSQNLALQQPPSPDLDSILQAQIAQETFGRPGTGKGKQPQAKVGNSRGLLVLPSNATPYQTPYQDLLPSEAAKNIANAPNSSEELRFPGKRPWSALQSLQHTPITPAFPSQQQRPLIVPSSSTPVIDMIPKAKRREMYAFISGIQGGIEHLQKQLNSLKNTLGIDDDD